MKKEELVPVIDFCLYHNAEPEFINSLREYELIEITLVEDQAYLHPDHLPRLEKLVRLYYDLDINIQGIDVINNLLERMESMKQEMVVLKNRIQLSDDIWNAPVE